MPIEHHPSPEHLAEYAAGVGEIGVDLVVACHATLCPTCRAEIEVMEQFGGAMAERAGEHREGPPGSVEAATSSFDMDALVGNTLRAVDSLPARAQVARRAGPGSGVLGPVFPAPLRAYLPDPSDIAWRRVLPGAARFDLDVPGHRGPPMHLKKLQPGLRIPQHGHRGQEFDLVLQGGIKDHTRARVFDRGDLSYADASTEHALSILPGDECITFSVAEASVEAATWWARILYRRAGW